MQGIVDGERAVSLIRFMDTNEPQQISFVTGQIESPVIPSVWSHSAIVGGLPVIDGFRVPAPTFVEFLRSGPSDAGITDDYPALPSLRPLALEIAARETLKPKWLSGTSSSA